MGSELKLGGRDNAAEVNRFDGERINCFAWVKITDPGGFQQTTDKDPRSSSRMVLDKNNGQYTVER